MSPDSTHSSERSEPQQGLGRRARKAIAARRALFDAGLHAFERQPIGLVSVLDITEEADVAKGVFYLHFRSKDAYLLELWEDVARSILDDLRAAITPARSRTARRQAAVETYAALTERRPAAVRYWMRMSAVFPDEIGEPGHLARIRIEFLQELAATLSGTAVNDTTERDLQRATLLDAVCWATLRSSMFADQPVCTTEQLVRIINASLRAVDATRDGS